jgi:hypothetical protein
VVAALVLLSALWGKRPDAQWQPFGDQSSHLMATMSLWHDFDLRYTRQDLDRFNARFPAAQGPRGAFLKQNADGALYFAKPPLFPVLAAPFYGLLGTSGLVVFNLLALALMALLTVHAIRETYGQPMAEAMTAALFLLGPFMAWSMVAHPDVLIALLLFAGGFLLLRRTDSAALLASGLLLGLAVSEKPTFALLLPFLWMAARGNGLAPLGMLCLGLALGWLLPTSLQLHQDGHVFSYLGARFGLNEAPFPLEPGWVPPTGNLVEHVFAAHEVAKAVFFNLHLVPEKLLDLLVGRQSGLLPYFPVAVVLVLSAMLTRQPRALALVAAFLLHHLLLALAFPTNGFGGAQSYGSRYLMQTLPLLPLALLAARSAAPAGAPAPRAAAVVGALAIALTLALQHRTLPPSEDTVADPGGFLLYPPGSWFRLEPSLLPWLPIEDPGFRTPSPAREASLFFPDGSERGMLTVGAQGGHSALVLHQHDATRPLPRLTLAVSAPVQASVFQGPQRIWQGLLTPGRPQRLPELPTPLRSQAYDLFSQRHVRWDGLTIHWGPRDPGDPTYQAVVGFEAQPPENLLAPGRFVSPAEFRLHGIKTRFQWSAIEDWGMWSNGGYAEIDLPLPAPGESLEVTLRARAVVTTDRPLQQVDVLLNGRPFTTWAFSTDSPQDLTLLVAAFPEGRAVIGFLVRDPVSPRALGLGDDDRLLGLGLLGLAISNAPPTR